MNYTPHSRVFIPSFNKLADAAEMAAPMSSVTRKTPVKPATVGDVFKTTRKKSTRPQFYSQPVGKTDVTNPNTSAQQKAVPPPPVQ